MLRRIVISLFFSQILFLSQIANASQGFSSRGGKIEMEEELKTTTTTNTISTCDAPSPPTSKKDELSYEKQLTPYGAFSEIPNDAISCIFVNILAPFCSFTLKSQMNSIWFFVNHDKVFPLTCQYFFSNLFSRTDIILNDQSLNASQKMSALNNVHAEMISGLIDFLPSPENALEAFSSVLVETVIWNQIEERIHTEFGVRVEKQFGDEIRRGIWSGIMDQVGYQFWFKFRDPLWGQVGDQVMCQVGSKVDEHLKKFWIKPTLLDIEVRCILLFYQFGSLLMRYSVDLIKIRNCLKDSLIRCRFTEDQAQAILSRIRIPENGESPLINTQLELMRQALKYFQRK